MLLLFDLDGTVLTFEGDAPGPGRNAFDQAVLDLYGLPGASTGLRFAGGTDRMIARMLLRKAGVAEDDASIDVLLQAYVERLARVLQVRRYRQIGDVRAVVEASRAHGAKIAVATGNVRAGARLKLESAGLADAFHLDHGGYGCDALERADILRRAVERTVEDREERDVVVIGDTEHDVKAGRAIGARVIGVGITATARAELADAGADAIVTDCDGILRVLFT